MFKIGYGSNLKGEIKVSGSKNAGLPIIAANYIIDNQIKLNNVAEIKDIQVLNEIANNSFKVSKDFFDLTSPLATKIRSSIFLIPVGLIKYGKVKFIGSGGCKIGKRPLDTFDDALTQAGIKITNHDYKIYEIEKKPLKKIILQEFSVSATESLITYLSFIQNYDYEIEIHNIAIEPHVINLIEYLQNIGISIKLNPDHSLIISPSMIRIKNLEFNIIGDYLEAGYYLAVGAGVENSEITISNFMIKDLYYVLNVAKSIGINIEIINNNSIKVNSYNKLNYKSVKIQTQIFPGFPTDLQSIFGTLLTQANGISKIFETLFEGRFSYLTELENLGAKIEILNPHQAIIVGPSKLHGGYVSTTDLRGGGAMVLAGIMANGETFITNEDIILRGYENIEFKLKSIGVNIEKI